MATEQANTLQGLQIAIQMEIDGKKFYLKTSAESANELGRELLQKLAAEEDVHRHNFEIIYDGISRKKAWPTTDFRPDRGQKLRTIFARASEETGATIKTAATEMDAIKMAMDMEIKSYDFYKSQSQAAAYSAQKGFYEAIAAEEREHHLILLDYYEYLKDPAAWFVAKEHSSLDGG